VEAEMLHELDVVHVDLLAEVALESHVRLELAAQHLKQTATPGCHFWGRGAMF
jgi:hypothetical protein